MCQSKRFCCWFLLLVHDNTVLFETTGQPNFKTRNKESDHLAEFVYRVGTIAEAPGSFRTFSKGFYALFYFVLFFLLVLFKKLRLSGPVRDTPPYRAIPSRDHIAEGGIARFCLVFIGYRASIAEIPLLWGGGVIAPPLRMLSRGGNSQKRGRGYRTQLAMLRHRKPHSAQ